MLIVDANIVLRLILNDHREMVEKARTKLQTNTFSIKREVIAEVVYVLAGVYKTDRQNVGKAIFGVLDTEGIVVESEDAVRYAINTYQTQALDFVDCMLYAYQNIEGEDIFTFDQKLQRLLG
jgi:predicted nucleic-acid-binding protein